MKLINPKLAKVFAGKELIVSKEISQSGKIKLNEDGTVDLGKTEGNLLLTIPDWQVYSKEHTTEAQKTQERQTAGDPNTQDDEKIVDTGAGAKARRR